jgi:competence protein ComEC
MRYRRSVLFLAAWIFGIFVGTQSITTLPFAILIIGLGSALFLQRKVGITFSIILLSFSLAVTYSRHWRRENWRAVRPSITTFTGTIAISPDVREKNQLVTVLTDQEIGQTVSGKSTQLRVLVIADKYLPLKTGQHVRVKSKVEPPLRTGQFNYPLYLEQRKISAIAPFAQVDAIGETPRTFHPLDPFTAIRQWCEHRISRSIPDPEASFAAGLVLGSRKFLPARLQDDLKLTGTTHLIAVSGANITFMIGGLLAVAPARRRPARTGVILAGATFIAAVTGGSASVVRGAIAVSIAALVRCVGRKAWPAVSFLLVMALMLTCNPLLLRADPSFQLSCAAYAGLLTVAGLASKALHTLRAPPFIQQPLAETIAATIGTAPLSLAMGSFTLWGLIANPLILWLIPYATFWGFLLILIGWIPVVAALCGVIAWLILHIALGTITFSARLAEAFS